MDMALMHLPEAAPIWDIIEVKWLNIFDMKLPFKSIIVIAGPNVHLSDKEDVESLCI